MACSDSPQLVLDRFSYLVGQPPARITPADPQWRAALPLDRRSATQSPLLAGSAPCYGHYFAAARQFLLRDQMAVAVSAASVLLQRTIRANQIEHIAIHLAKHGAFYHPARVVVTIGADRLALVLNVAVCEPGLSTLMREYKALEHLHDHAGGFLPRVFGSGTERSGGFDLALFAAEWFEGFWEFHLSRAPDGSLQWQVWADREAPLNLSLDQIDALYRQAARILTTCYNPLTFESVLEWHHAAGDFIVNPQPNRLAVRLITIRRYAPLFRLEANARLDLERLLDGLAAFFLDLSLRMRIDRLDGVGMLVWAPDRILSAVWGGFGQGLEQMAALHGLPAEFAGMVRQFLAAHPPHVLAARGGRITARYARTSGERALIVHHLKDHLRVLGDLMASDRIG